MFEALSNELLVPYVRYCSLKSLPLSAEMYMKWVEKFVQDPFYLYLFDICFTFLLAFYLYTESVRKGSHDNMIASRTVFTPLFFASLHPFYQELLVKDMLDRARYPKPLDTYTKSTESFNLSGDGQTGQGADFLHEELNRTVKDFIPPGKITGDTWVRVCRKTDKLKEIRAECMIESSVAPEKSVKRPLNFENEVTIVRKGMRDLLHEPEIAKPMSGIGNVELDDGLADIKHKARDNYALYKQHLAETGKYGLKLEPVFVTKSEKAKYNDIANKTKVEIKQEIEKIVEVMPDLDLAEEWKTKLGSLKKQSKKVAYPKIYWDVSEALTDMLSRVVVPSDESEQEPDDQQNWIQYLSEALTNI